jgi:radical SAM superfamily enzyme YgiQ (UPF0313 family)
METKNNASPFIWNVKKKIYLVQPTYRDHKGRLLQGKSLFLHSLAVPAISAVIPPEWEKEICLEYFNDVNYETDASVVGISCMVCDVFHGREIADVFRKRGKVVLVGGCAADLWKGLMQSAPDALVYGYPGPEEMRKILDDAVNGCLASEYRCGMNVDFPFDYSVLAGRRIAFMPALSSVGCINECKFCCTAAMCKGKYHLRPLNNVMTDLRIVRRMTRRVAFVDTNLYNNRDHLIELCEHMIAEDMGFIWGAECTVNVGEDLEVLRLLRRAGCRMLILGIETINQTNLREMGKPNVACRCRDQIRRIRDTGIYVGGFFILGFDADDGTTVDDLFNFMRDVRVSVPFVNLLTPVPGTRLFDKLKKEGRMLMKNDEDFLRQNLLYDTPMYRCYFVPKRMSPAEAEAAFLDLRQRISSFPEIIRRSLVLSPFMAAVILRSNLRFRAETRAIARTIHKEMSLGK